MTTPKEKADELVKKMDVIHKFKLNNGKFLPVSMHRSQMVGCAIIAVEEILKTEPHEPRDIYAHPDSAGLDHKDKIHAEKYWEDVLTELKQIQS